MTRIVHFASAALVLTVLVPSARAQDGCCPPYVPPTCMAPSCLAPSCLAPSCVAPEGCGNYAGGSSCCCQTSCCQNQCCQNSCDQGQYCAPKRGGGLFSRWNNRSVHIDLSKTIIKKNHWGGFGEAPPTGFAVSSMPVLPLSVSAVPVSFNTAAASNSNNELVAAMLEVLKNRPAAAVAAPTAASAGSCPDPCGDIKQLQSDVQQLTQITQNLTAAVAELAKRETADNQ